MADNIQATPRNYLGGLLSDAYNWMQSPQRTQQMQGFAGLLGTTGIPQTIERMAYGEPLTNIGRANVPLLKPETADALMTVAGFAPEIKAAAKMLPKNVPIGMSIKDVGKFTYPQEEAMRLAQQRAALPKEQFGLGLPPNNTAQQRADAMFPFDVYHGTNADIQVMNTAGKGKTSGAGAFVNDNPLAAETYVNAAGGGNIIPMRMSKEGLLDVNAKGRNWADIETNTLAPKAGKKRYSLDEMELQKNDVTSTDELGMIAKDLLGLQGVNIKNVKDLGPNSHIFRAKEYLQDKYGIVPDETWSNVTGNQFAEARDYMDNLYKSQKSTVTAVQNPDLLRSRFAAFDPWRKTAATAAAMGVAAPDLLAQEQQPYQGLLGR